MKTFTKSFQQHVHGSVAFPTVQMSCRQGGRLNEGWPEAVHLSRCLLLPSVSWPQLWVIRDRIAIPVSSHLISRRPRRIFCRALLPAHLELETNKKKIGRITYA